MNSVKTRSQHFPLPSPAPPSPVAIAAGTEPPNHRHHHHLILSYSAALAGGVPPHPHAFPPLLKSCASLGLLPPTFSLHQQSLVLGYAPDAHISTSLIHAYAKNGDVDSARRVFDGMPHRNVVPWSALVACYSQSGDVDMAFYTYNRMRSHDIQPNSVTVLGLLSGVSRTDHLQCLHACAIRCGFDTDLVLANSMLNVYSKCGRVELARRLFDSMPFKDIVSWNSMVAGYSRTGGVRESMDLFGAMRLRGIQADHQTYGSLVSAITDKGGGSIQPDKSVHALVLTSGFGSDAHVETALISMYLKFGSLDHAFLLFDQASNRDVVSWTAMISGLVQNDGADKALAVFHRMLRSGVMPATTTIASALSACAQLGSFGVGASIHGFSVRRRLPLDIAAHNSLLTMYAKCGHLNRSRRVFEEMLDRDLVSWNALVSGYVMNGHLDEPFFLFNRMRSAYQRPDAITVVSLLQACASSGARLHGKSVHNFIVRHKLGPFISVDTSLVDMYSKCGDLETAQRCFSMMPEHDKVSWSAIIGGYGSHGMGEVALGMYSDFLRTTAEPNDVMFLSVLSACSHAGLVPQGLRIFKSMEEDFRLVPRIEHCACIIDLLSRAGRVEEALGFIKTMSPLPNADVLGILLDACRVNGHVRLVEEVVREIVALRPESAGNYVQLAQSYAAMGRWDGVGETWAQMRNLGLRKAPGWSFIELSGTLITFFADHSSHPQHEEMIQVLKILDSEMRKIDGKLCRLVIGDQLLDLAS